MNASICSVGSFYKASGKFNIGLVVVATLVAAVIAVGVGALYAFLSDLNPFIYLNFLLLIGVFFGVTILTGIVTSIAKSRNRIVNILIALTLSLVAYYAHWAYLCAEMQDMGFFSALLHPLITIESIQLFSSIREITISKSGRNGVTISGAVLQIFYAVEFLVFLAPTVFATSVDYFCEACNTEYSSKELFAANDGQLDQQVKNSSLGKYGFIDGLNFDADHEALLNAENAPKSLLKLNYHQCPSCKKSSLLSINHVTYKKEKDEFKEDDDTSLVTGVYIDQETDQILARQI